jgi:hypothetical protein
MAPDAKTRTCDQEDLRAALSRQVVHPYIEGQNLQPESRSKPALAAEEGSGQEHPPRA